MGGRYTLCVLTCANNEWHLFSGKTKLDCVSTNNILVESFEFLMEYFMTFRIRKSDGETEKKKTVSHCEISPHSVIIKKKKDTRFFMHAVRTISDDNFSEKA